MNFNDIFRSWYKREPALVGVVNPVVGLIAYVTMVASWTTQTAVRIFKLFVVSFAKLNQAFSNSNRENTDKCGNRLHYHKRSHVISAVRYKF